MAFHCPRCSDFVAKAAKSCANCGADFAVLGWEPVPGPTDVPLTESNAQGRASAKLIVLLLVVPVLFCLITGLILLAPVSTQGAPFIAILWVLLILAMVGVFSIARAVLRK